MSLNARLHVAVAERGEGDPAEVDQSVVDELLRLEAMGYVGRCEALTEAFTGRGYVNRVYVRGGLSEEGRGVLQSLGAPTARGEKPA